MPDVHAEVTVRAGQAIIERLLVHDPDLVLGVDRSVDSPVGDSNPGRRVTLTLDVGGGTSVSQVVALQLGGPIRRDDWSSWPVSWRPVDHRALVPSFDGQLEVRPQRWATSLRLLGWYRAPLGPL